MMHALLDAVGPSGVLTSAADMERYLVDWRGRYRGAASAVVLPSSTSQVAALVKLCRDAGQVVLPQGGNTSLCGGAVPDPNGPPPVIISLERLRRIRSIDPVNNAICVDAGCVLATVQRAAADADRLYPVSLGAEGSCQIGGTVATNAGGTGVLRYGNTRENVLGLEAVLPDGSMWNGLNGLRKNNTGYDLKQLFIGSEGTLGIITGAVLKLHPLPSARATAWLALATPQAAVDVLGLFRDACAAQLSAFELINDVQVSLMLEHIPNRRSPFTAARWHVLVELSDTSSNESLDASMQEVLARTLEAGLVRDAAVATSEAQRAAMWEFRHSVSEANKKGGVGLTTDCAVPVSAVPDFIENATAAVRALVPDLPVVVVCHLGDGNVHFIPFFTFGSWDARGDRDDIAAALRRAVNDEASALEGTFSAEHGVGQTQLAEMARYKSPVELALMRAIKRTLDPKDLFNPGRLVPAE